MSTCSCSGVSARIAWICDVGTIFRYSISTSTQPKVSAWIRLGLSRLDFVPQGENMIEICGEKKNKSPSQSRDKKVYITAIELCLQTVNK